MYRPTSAQPTPLYAAAPLIPGAPRAGSFVHGAPSVVQPTFLPSGQYMIGQQVINPKPYLMPLSDPAKDKKPAQPDHSKARSVDELFSSLDLDADGNISEAEMLKYFEKVDLILTRSESRLLFLEMDKDGNGSISLEEFRAVYERVKAIKTPIPGDQAISQSFRKAIEQLKSESPDRIHVFLGGSCNPTTWRKDIVMPILEQNRVLFYNPQVDDWYPELVEIERKAKESAIVLLFVIDNQTRAVVSMLEVAEYMGSGRHTVLSVQSIEDGAKIQDSVITGDELKALNAARDYVCDLAASCGIDVFASTQMAARHLAALFDPSKVIVNRKAFNAPPKFDTVDFATQAEVLFKEYDSDKNGYLDKRELQLVLGRLGFTPNATDMDTIFRLIDINKSKKIELHEFRAFLSYVASNADKQAVLEGFAGKSVLGRGLQSIDQLSFADKSAVDVYLGGSFEGVDWRSKEAIPALKAAGLTFISPKVGEYLPSFAWIEARDKERCKVLLFVVPHDSRSIRTLADAAYYIGKGRNMVLVVNDIPENASFGSHKVTPLERKDLNRGRAYLLESASRAKIPVFKTVAEALAEIKSNLARGRK
eukprot:TRINITY_DN1750_c0_g1_i1.p1 TRINITY_DN1750_c0_g1~~TRINITY_DN1750_c0_g1_i1.p1  ORF type:complete len:592 (-),score=147.34 TRINITY_DN1750_c0_g1_i1:218-1993(-)